MLGDGEHQEGMVWESVLCARRYGLDNLVAIVDRNGLQQYGWAHDGVSESRFDRLDPWAGVDLAGVYRAFGWNVLDIDGHDMQQIQEALEAPRSVLRGSGRPTVVMARTVKGKGISFTEGRYAWHNGVADDVQLARAQQDLGLDPEEGA
jgi:transketolase